MILEMYEVREKLSDLFANVLPPLVQTAEHMTDGELAQTVIYYCKEIDALTSRLHRVLPREVEVRDEALKVMLGVGEDEVETGLERLIRDIQETDKALNGKGRAPVGSKDPFQKVWTRDNGARLQLIAGGKKDEGPFKRKGV